MASLEEARARWRAHLDQLDDVKAELGQYVTAKPYTGQRVEAVPADKFMAACQRMKQWEDENRRLRIEFVEALNQSRQEGAGAE